MWRSQKKGEVQAAVKTAKEDLKSKATELLTVQKQLAQEQKAHAKVGGSGASLRGEGKARGEGGRALHPLLPPALLLPKKVFSTQS